MRQRIEKYRRTPPNPHTEYEIGCIILSESFFLNEEAWLPVPEDFSRSIQQGKNYDILQSPGRQLWEAVTRSFPRSPRQRIGDEVLWGTGFTKHRLGQGIFQMRVIDAYQRRCASPGRRPYPFSKQHTSDPLPWVATMMSGTACFFGVICTRSSIRAM